MDFQRLFLFAIFSFSLMMVWDGWQRYQHPETPSAVVKTLQSQGAEKGVIAGHAEIVQSPAEVATGKIIKVRTDLMTVDINTLGGDIQGLDFLKHPDRLDKNKNFALFEKGPGTHNYVAQTGLLGAGLPNHTTQFTSEQDTYQLNDKSDKLQVVLKAAGLNGVRVSKIITFHRDSYVVDVTYEIENDGTQPVRTSAYYQFTRDDANPAGVSKMVPTFTGVAVYTDKDKFQKVSFSDIDKGKVKYPAESNSGWIGILQHYFVSAWIPDESSKREFYTRKLKNGLYSAGLILPFPVVAPGQKATMTVPFYAGPAESQLNAIAPGLGLTVDYGWLTVVATPIFWTLSFIHGLVNNWGVAIIILTLLIKILFFPLSAASYRSMAKMRMVAPKLEKIKQQYANDREQLNRAMMDIYKTEKINPLGGCLPVVIQIPVFISLYWSILASVEMRYAPFFGWITDLSAPDPYYVLPVLMGISMLLQSRLNPAPPDPMQAKLMKIMPVAFSVMFFFFPAGLVLYSIVNNGLSIAQQWYITRKIGAVGGAAKN
jgi:YidC/Oxa1 family membrane protein insertase